MLTKKFFCPVNGWDCPYWKEDGSCSMVDDGDNPVMECDDAAYFWDEEQPDCFVWVDENGKQYEVQELLEQGYHFVNGEPVDPMKMEDNDDFLDWAKEKFGGDEWNRLVDIIRGE